MIDERYSRSSFEAASPDARSNLASDLEHDLTERLLSSPNPCTEAQGIVAELKELGHRLYLFDEDGEAWQIWCYDWTDQQSAPGLTVEFDYPAGEPWSVSVTFGRTPEPTELPTPLSCPACHSPMKPTTARLHAYGHGMIGIPYVRVLLCLGDQEQIELNVSTRSYGLLLCGSACERRGGIWLPSQKPQEW
jgi:hypothetical protein